MDFAMVDLQIQSVDDFFPVDGYMKIFDFE
jgi:hypothetical protein